MKKIVTMGEIMLRLSPQDYQMIEQAKQFDVVYGGGEANVALSLSRLGMKTEFVSKLPDNPIGASAQQYLNQFGVMTDHIAFGGDRLGIYFLEKGYSIRPSKVVYDRSASAFSTSTLEDYNFAEIFRDADWFHISGITPALNNNLFLMTQKALQVAKEMGITTSCDLNYRSSLWSFQDAREKMTELIQYVDVCIGIEPLQLLSENGVDMKDLYSKPLRIEDCKEIILKLQEAYSIKKLAMTFRESISVNRNRLKAILSDGEQFYQSSEIDVEIVDRVGTGDAFSAGMIYGLINNYQPKDVIEFATACFALKHTVDGDANLLNKATIEQFLKQKGNLEIKR